MTRKHSYNQVISRKTDSEVLTDEIIENPLYFAKWVK